MARLAALPPLARSTVDRAAHLRKDEQWLVEAWPKARVLVVDSASGGVALVRDSGSVSLVLVGSSGAPDVPPAERLFLGLDPDGTAMFAVDAPLPDLPEARAASVREVGHLLDDRDAGLLTAAVALAQWHAAHRYSPVTGAPTTTVEGGWARVDPDGGQLWPRTDPAVIVVVHDGVSGPEGRCLLGHNAAWRGGRGTRRFSCLAGFVEPGESAEAAVAREVFEEVGVRVAAPEYVASQAWPFPGSLMLGFMAYADPAQPVETDPTEIAEARWFSRRDVGAMLAAEPVPGADGVPCGLPMASSIAAYLIETWHSETRPRC